MIDRRAVLRLTRPGHSPGRGHQVWGAARGLIGTVLFVLLFGAVAPQVAAGPTDSILDVLQLGSRADLGLGGEPFLSPLRRETGWWRQDLLDGAADVQLRSLQHLPVTARLSGGDGRLEYVANRFGARYELARWNRRLGLSLALTSSRTTTSWQDDGISACLAGQGEAAAGVVRLTDIIPRLDGQVAFPLGQAARGRARDDLRGGFHYALLDMFYIASSWSRGENRAGLAAVLDDETVEIPFNLAPNAVRHEARVRPWRGLATEIMVSESDHRALDDLTGRGDEFLPEAKSRFRQQGIEWESNGWKVLTRHSDFDLRADGGGYWEGQRYLRLSHTEAHLQSWLVAVARTPGPARRLFIEFERTRLDAFGRIDVDSWRFASWQEAWLGAKKIIQLTGHARWERYHVAGESPWGAWKLGGGATWYEIRPDAFSETWIHVPLIRPRDYEKATIAVTRLSLAALSLQSSRRFGSFELSAELHQFVYADHHTTASSPQPEPPPDPSPAPISGPGGWYGGTFFEIALGYTF